MQAITAFFWVITQRGLVIPNRRFGTTNSRKILYSYVYHWSF